MFEAAVKALATPLIVHGPNQILFANAAAHCAMRASDHEALIGLEITSIVHPDGADAGRERRKLVLERGQVMHDVPVKLSALDGSTVYAHVTAQRIEWANDAAILLTARMLDG
jgi:PAS domain S-box-containing protein